MAEQKTLMFDTLRSLVRDMLDLRCSGVASARQARAGGYVDGYMRVLLDSGVASQRELLDLVRAERERFAGPASAVLHVDG